MRKREKRRMEAISNAGRRVKLDLDSTDSSAEVLDQKVKPIDATATAPPSSSSSSGQPPLNPLILLGQYSDDEFDPQPNLINAPLSADLVKETILHPYQQQLKDVILHQHDSERRASASPQVSQNMEGNDDDDEGATSCQDIGSTKDMLVTGSSDVHVVGDFGSGWKIVMHQASDKYYYWNIDTGETSWEVPHLLSGETGLNNEHKTSPSDSNVDEPKGVIDGPQVENLSTECRNNDNVEVTNLGLNASSDELCRSSAVDMNSSQHSTDGMHIVNIISNEDKAAGAELPCSILKYGEYLLERLNSVKRSRGQLEEQEWILKFIREVEIRLSDIRSLLSYGASLLPFWVHSERQLKMVEEVINSKDVQITDSAENLEVVANDVSNNPIKSRQNMGDEYKADVNENKIVSVSTNVNPVEAEHVLLVESHGDVIFPECNSLPSHETIYAGLVAEIDSEEVNRDSIHSKLSPKHHPEGIEDVDMDVDMEVDDELPASNNTSLGNFVPLQLPAEPYQPVEFPSEDAPPPLDDEWVPPPPPDNEPFPPPPPEEPPETSYPTPPYYPEGVQSFPYTNQYSVSQPISNFQYYGLPISEVPSSNLYGYAEGSQISVPQTPVYYEEVVSTTYPNTAPVIVDPISVESAIYYNLHDGGVVSSEFYTETGTVSYGTVTSDQNGFVRDPKEADGGSLPVKNEFALKASTEVACSVQAPAMISLEENVPVASTDLNSAVAPPATSAVTKVQCKALRSKKRTIAVASTLMSNKKVSNMVNKWKAAKEEMHEEEEEEPEDALEALEKKKQKEIELWRAQQIASGEAKGNANFQPLGGDWRERVKRRRGQLAREAKKATKEAVADEQRQQKVDLKKLSTDLPSGWQAYYDESSKKVYYGNAVTSETAWSRPRK